MNTYLLSNDKNLKDSIEIHILMNMESHWKTTCVYKLTKKEPSDKWIQQYRKIITNKFINKELL